MEDKKRLEKKPGSPGKKVEEREDKTEKKTKKQDGSKETADGKEEKAGVSKKIETMKLNKALEKMMKENEKIKNEIIKAREEWKKEMENEKEENRKMIKEAMSNITKLVEEAMIRIKEECKASKESNRSRILTKEEEERKIQKEERMVKIIKDSINEALITGEDNTTSSENDETETTENESDEEEEELSSEEESQENEKKIVRKEEKENNGEAYKMNNDESKPQALTEEQMREEWRKRKERKCNICITGCIPETWNSKENIEKEIEKCLKKKIHVKEIEIVKESEIKVKLLSWEDKRIIMKAKGELKGSDMWIDDDMTDREKGVQKWLRDRARNETNRGKTAQAKYQKLLIGRTGMRGRERWKRKSGVNEYV